MVGVRKFSVSNCVTQLEEIFRGTETIGTTQLMEIYRNERLRNRQYRRKARQ